MFWDRQRRGEKLLKVHTVLVKKIGQIRSQGRKCFRTDKVLGQTMYGEKHLEVHKILVETMSKGRQCVKADNVSRQITSVN